MKRLKQEQERQEKHNQNKLLELLKEQGKAICRNTVLLPDGTIKAARDCTTIEKINAICVYNFNDNKIYKI